WMAIPAVFDTHLGNLQVQGWKELFDLLVRIIDGLAYAHAHDAYALRLIPASVLAMSRGKSVVLSHLLPADQIDALLLPDLIGACYQAPERNADWQRAASAQEDLYLLGGLAWTLVSGEIPHGDARSFPELLERQRAGDPSTLPGLFDPPKGFRNWLAMMRAPHPEARFASTADARASLLEVDRLRGARRWEPIKAQLPSTWQRSWSTKRSRKEIALGINLLGLRPLPMVARGPERDRLWASFHEAVQGNHVCGAVLRGGPGIGKSRLLNWLKHRAVETGAAKVVLIRCNPSEAPGAAIARLIMRALEVGGTEPSLKDFKHALRRNGVSNHYEQDALASLASAPFQWQGWPSIRFKRSEDRFVVVARLLQRLSRRNALIILLDDAQWALDTLAVFRHLFGGDRPRGLRLFFVIATREKSKTLEGRQLSELLKQRRVQMIELEALRNEDMLHLLRDRLALVPDLASCALSWCAGSPMMAHSLIEAWVSSGELLASANGISHRAGNDIVLPKDLARLWTERLERVMLVLDPAVAEWGRWSLEVGALLGRSVDLKDWQGVCNQLGFEAPQTVIDLAVSEGLLWPTQSGWRFQHGTLRDALLIESENEGRLLELHGAIADYLEAHQSAEKGCRLRCGEHRLGAGELLRGFELLLEAESEARSAGDDLEAERALEMAEQATQQMTPEERAERSVQIDRRRVDLLRIRGAWTIATKAAVSLEKSATAAGDDDALILALRTQAQCAYEGAELEKASSFAVRAQAISLEAGNLQQTIHCELLLGIVAASRSELQQAVTFYEAARRRIESSFADDDILQGESLFHLGSVYQEQGKLKQALPLLIRSLRHWERCGGQRGMAGVANALADAARSQGRLDRAMDWYRRAKKVYDSVGAWQAHIVSLNLALVLMFDEQFEDAHREVMGCLQVFRDSAQPTWLAVSLVFALPGFAHRQDWTQFDEAIAEARNQLKAQGFAEADVARAFELAGDLAEVAGEQRRADLSFTLASEQWSGLGRAAEANAAALRVGTL
ncbi:MAG: tetratricopeptide repeat protein, partial [Myxococcota bacterium]|nr:tetratricopeptide repeat protein [Myxococcota bacterium]